MQSVRGTELYNQAEQASYTVECFQCWVPYIALEVDIRPRRHLQHNGKLLLGLSQNMPHLSGSLMWVEAAGAEILIETLPHTDDLFLGEVTSHGR